MTPYYYYFLIITPGRMIFYGGCNVKWSNFGLQVNTLLNISANNGVKSSCLTPNSDNEVLVPFFNAIKYVNYQNIEGVPYLTFYDEKFAHVATFDNRSPSYPSTWP